jgi:hypothetical protein
MDKELDAGVCTSPAVKRVRRTGAQPPRRQIPKKDPLPRFRFHMPGMRTYPEWWNGAYDRSEDVIFRAATYLNHYAPKLRRALKRDEISVKFEPFTFRAANGLGVTKLDGYRALCAAWLIMYHEQSSCFDPRGVSNQTTRKKHDKAPTIKVVKKYLDELLSAENQFAIGWNPELQKVFDKIDIKYGFDSPDDPTHSQYDDGEFDRRDWDQLMDLILNDLGPDLRALFESPGRNY